jgi:hypothetical protein
VNVCPAAVIVPLRAAPAFTATRYSIVPSPLPDWPDVMVSQSAFWVAAHAHPDPAVTWIVPAELSEPTLLLVGAMLNTQGCGGMGGGAVGSGFRVAAPC